MLNILHSMFLSVYLSLLSINLVPIAKNLQLLCAEGSVAKTLEEEVHFPESGEPNSMLSITVVGASGDLAKKKIFPALFALYYEDWLPEVVFSIFQIFLLVVNLHKVQKNLKLVENICLTNRAS